MMRRYLATIQKSDIGKTRMTRALYKQSINIGSALGYVQARDVGKYVYSVDEVIQVENDQQMKDRLHDYLVNPEVGYNLRSVKISFANGDVITTSMARDLTDEMIREYYAIGRKFNVGSGPSDRMTTVASVDILK